MNDAAAVRACFSAAAEGFAAAVSVVAPGDWDRPALGVWTVRDLAGHASRALSTIEAYLAQPAGEIEIHDPVDYLLAIRGPAVSAEAIAARGREAGAALGDHPAVAVRALAQRVTALVAASPDDAPVGTAVGRATLLAYLPTRTFELTVHTLDLVAALGADPPVPLVAPIAACLILAASAAGRGADAGAVLLALSGRRGLPPGFSVV